MAVVAFFSNLLDPGFLGLDGRGDELGGEHAHLGGRGDEAVEVGGQERVGGVQAALARHESAQGTKISAHNFSIEKLLRTLSCEFS